MLLNNVNAIMLRCFWTMLTLSCACHQRVRRRQPRRRWRSVPSWSASCPWRWRCSRPRPAARRAWRTPQTCCCASLWRTAPPAQPSSPCCWPAPERLAAPSANTSGIHLRLCPSVNTISLTIIEAESFIVSNIPYKHLWLRASHTVKRLNHARIMHIIIFVSARTVCRMRNLKVDCHWL